MLLDNRAGCGEWVGTIGLNGDIRPYFPAGV